MSKPFAPDVEVASKIAPLFALQAVNFAVIDARILGAADSQESSRLKWDLAPIETRWSFIEEELRAIVPFGFTVSSVIGDTATVLVTIQIVLRVDYLLRPDKEMPGDEELGHFVGLLTFMHGWPYVRAEVQLLTSKLGLPALVLPVMVSGQVPKLVSVMKLVDSSLGVSASPPKELPAPAAATVRSKAIRSDRRSKVKRKTAEKA